MTVDELTAEVTVRVRRSLFQRLKHLNISQSELTGLVAGATKAAITRAGVSELAEMALAGAAVAATVEALDPDDAALVEWKARRTTVNPRIRDLTTFD